MPINTYKCNKCEFTDEYVESTSTTKECWHPEKCPECGKGELEKIFDLAGHRIGIDFIGPGFYINDHGIHAWKKRLSMDEQVKVLKDNKDPY